tara:strand:+ start:1518 stop:2171 length:654 start_codon:yes stop_codon:yes gene_type:complete
MSSWKINRPWLIQRLSKGSGYKNPFGDVNNGVDLKGIEQIIKPDYMGAAEFEWGKYGSTLEKMVEAKFKGDLYLKKVPIKIWQLCNESDDGNVVSKTNVGVWISVIYWCSETTTLDDITARIQQIADRSDENPDFKWWGGSETSKNDYGSFNQALMYKYENDKDGPLFDDKLATGWLDVDTENHCGLMWFVDNDFAVKVMKYFSKLSKAKHNEMISE